VLAAALLATNNTAEATRERDLARQLSSRFDEWDQRPREDAVGGVPRGLERASETEATPVRADSGLVSTTQQDHQQLARFHFDRGLRLEEQQQDREAISEFRKSLYLAPYDAQTHLALGRVLVRSGEQSRLLGAGDRWSSLPQAPEPTSEARAAEPAATEQEQSAPAAAARRSAPAPARLAKPPDVVASELAAQNRLLESAKLAQRGGMPALAVQRLETLIARYPDAELAHNARVERFRLLRGSARSHEAITAAREYLARHPDGFARAEAEQLIDGEGAPLP